MPSAESIRLAGSGGDANRTRSVSQLSTLSTLCVIYRRRRVQCNDAFRVLDHGYAGVGVSTRTERRGRFPQASSHRTKKSNVQ